MPQTAPKPAFNNIAQKALREATSASSSSELSIKGAGNLSAGNVVEVTGLVDGTTAEDVAAIFKRCGAVTDQKLVEGGVKAQTVSLMRIKLIYLG